MLPQSLRTLSDFLDPQWDAQVLAVATRMGGIDGVIGTQSESVDGVMVAEYRGLLSGLKDLVNEWNE